MTPTHCPNCGAAITQENNGEYCVYCGGKLPKEETEQNITNNYDNRVENHYHTTNVYQVQKPTEQIISYQLPENQRKSKINSVFVTGLFVGILLIIAGIFGESVFLAALGAIISVYALTRKKYTNYCTSCYAPKDFHTSKCPQCGKKFQAYSKLISGGFIFFGLIAVLVLIALLLYKK